MEKRPKIKITIIDRKGPKGCHRGHKVGDTFDYNPDGPNIHPELCFTVLRFWACKKSVRKRQKQ